MARKAKDLTALEVGRLTKPGNHAVGGVAGLYLSVNDGSGRSWILRVMVGDRRRHIGLGGYPDVPLALARDRARAAKQQILDGIDPIAQRKEMASKLRARQAASKSFREAAQAYIDAHGDTWKNSKHRSQWVNTLNTYAYPVLGKLAVGDIGQEQVLAVLEPIWKSKNETASRLRGRIEIVLDWATVRGYRTGENPARWKGHLDKLLPAPGKVQQREHLRAMPIDAMPAFMEKLRLREGLAAQALAFLIFTAARSGEVRGARWDEIDLNKKVWIIPGKRMKAGREHRVPLSDAAMRILLGLPRLQDNPLVFPSANGGLLSDMTLTAVLRRMAVDVVPHGFRSSFRDWAGEMTGYPRELAEQALAHTIENKVEAAYRRGDAIAKRREMMNDWAQYCLGCSKLLD